MVRGWKGSHFYRRLGLSYHFHSLTTPSEDSVDDTLNSNKEHEVAKSLTPKIYLGSVSIICEHVYMYVCM